MSNIHVTHLAALKIILAYAINPFSNSSHVLCSFRNKKIVHFDDFKMTLGSQMELQNNVLGNFWSRRVDFSLFLGYPLKTSIEVK